ncbi:cation:proton antiporter [Corynebacterium sp. 13CS0277]|uniref:DUF4040 family protein n=1 Tax=Corynebacterium sp. 13CS0277 TaxID=2071994 RepID=UPI000D02A99B|nr:DUF4040 family protein [Corynebacterium sp. 13CS0277]PRQ12147.1 cation:proton antiporter [Corynebacterium sp. 13CS0277]
MSAVTPIVLAGVAFVLSPLAVALFDRRAGYPLAAIYAAAAVALGSQMPGILRGNALEFSRVWVPSFVASGMDASFALRADALGAFFALLALTIGAVVFVYSAAYLHRGHGNGSFYVIMSGFMLGVLLLVLANDVTLLFIAWELVSIGSFLLIARAGSGGEAGSYRTLILTFTGGLLLLIALAISATAAGTTSLQGILDSQFWVQRPALTTTLAVLFALAGFTKAAQLPFHFWLPEAMAAATPVSAFLHAAAVVKAGVYLLLRMSTVFHDNHVWNVLLIATGMTTAVMASLFAVQKTDLKKLTAYSTVSHLGWIVTTIGVGTPFALGAAVVHTAAHALFKSSLFMLIGVIDHQAGSRDVRRLGKLYKQMPFTFVSVIFGALSMAAVPPLLGFVSKEGMLEAFEQAPIAHAGIVVLLVAAGVGALLTFTYSARLVLGAFVDGPRDMSEVREAPVSLWLPAALPGVLSLPAVAFLGAYDEPIDALVGTVISRPHMHLALWHGVTTPLMISTAVIVLGCVGIAIRRGIYSLVDGHEFLPFSGNSLLQAGLKLLSRWGRVCAQMANSFSPVRHMTYPLLVVLALATWVAINPGIDGVPMAPRIPNSTQWGDGVALLIVALATLGLVRTKNRMFAAILLGVAGVGVTLQILLLGAPDVALTQFMVELLVVVIIMLVVRFQPANFKPAGRRHTLVAAALACGMGVAAGLAVWTMMGRNERPELAMWYLNNAPEISGGDNIVNTILVEFRALDTMGELSVLGMAGVVIAAVVGSIPRHPFARGTNPPKWGLAGINSIPMTQLIRPLVPVLLVASFAIFMRGHNAPGGGFIAALVAGAALMLGYLARPADGPVLGQRWPLWLTGFGILTALGTGLVGLVVKGSFLYAIHGHIGPEHVSSSMVFDVGVFMSVIGMLALGVNALGGAERPGSTQELLPFARDGRNPLPAHPGEEFRPHGYADWAGEDAAARINGGVVRTQHERS